MTAIQEGANDGNPNTAGDPSWQSLINNPNYPDYTSGANNVTGAMTRTLALFFGKGRMTFQVTSNAPPVVQRTRTYQRFSAYCARGRQRPYPAGHPLPLCRHRGADAGPKVAEHVYDHFLLPVPGASEYN